MPANHMGTIEGTMGRNISQLDFPHLQEVEQTLMQQKKLPAWEDSGTLCPLSLVPDCQTSKSCLTLPGQILDLTAGNFITIVANCCQNPQEKFFGQAEKTCP